jgi:hypothetical protein
MTHDGDDDDDDGDLWLTIWAINNRLSLHVRNPTFGYQLLTGSARVATNLNHSRPTPPRGNGSLFRQRRRLFPRREFH